MDLGILVLIRDRALVLVEEVLIVQIQLSFVVLKTHVQMLVLLRVLVEREFVTVMKDSLELIAQDRFELSIFYRYII